MGGRRNAPELLNEDGDARPSAQTQRPFNSSADGQPAAYMIDGDMPAKQKQRVQRDLEDATQNNNNNQKIKASSTIKIKN
jgi:hypothetical protein